MSFKKYFTDWDKKIVALVLESLLLMGKRGVQLFAFSRYQWAFIFILSIGLGLRFQGIFTAEILSEELLRIREIFGLISFNNHFKYQDSSFYSVLLIFPTLLVFVVGSAKVWFLAPIIFKTYGLSPMVYPYAILAGRLFGVVLFAITLFLLYQMGRRFFNERVGLLASFILALMPIAVQTSRFVLPQNGLLLFSVLLCYSFLFYLYENKKRGLLFFSLIWGLLSATTFHALYLSPVILFAFILFDRKSWLPFLSVSLGSYFLATIYLHVDLPLRLDSIAYSFQQRWDLFHQISFSETFLALYRFLGGGLIFAPLLVLGLFKKSSISKTFLISSLILVGFFFILFSNQFVLKPEDLLFVLVPLIFWVALWLDCLAQKRRGLYFVFLGVYSLLLFPELSTSFKESSFFKERLKSKTEMNPSFSPGSWEPNYLLGSPYRKMELIDELVQNAYSFSQVPYSLQKRDHELLFLAKWPRLKEIVFVLNNHSGEATTVELIWPTGEKSLGQVQAEKGWQDVSFPLEIDLEPEKYYRFVLKKSEKPIDLFYCDRNILLEQGVHYVDVYSVPQPDVTEVLFQVVYKDE